MAEEVRRKSQKVQAYASRGIEPPAELLAARNAPTPIDEQMAEEMLPGELTGIPSIARGTHRIANSDGDAFQIAAGAGEAALGAMPYAGAAARAISPVARSLAARAALPTVAAGAGLTGEAQAQDAEKAALAAGTKTQDQTGAQRAVQDVKGIFQEIFGGQEALVPYDQFLRERMPNRQLQDYVDAEQKKVMEAEGFDKLGSGIRDRRMKDAAARAQITYDKEMSPDALKAAEQRILGQYGEYKNQEKAKSQMPFNERYPAAAERLPVVGLLASMAVPALAKGLSNVGSFAPWSSASRASRTIADGERALAGNPTWASRVGLGNPTPASDVQKLRAENMLSARAAEEQSKKSFLGMTPKDGVIIGGAAGVNAEANMYPAQRDANVLERGSPRQKEAADEATNLWKYGEKAAMGLPSAVTGWKAGDMLTPQRKPDVARMLALRDTLKTGRTGGGGGNNPNQNPPVSFRRYDDVPQDMRDQMRDAYGLYASDQMARGNAMPSVAAGQRMIRAPYETDGAGNAIPGARMPVDKGRAKATNEAIEQHLTANPGTVVNSQTPIWSDRTIALAPGAALGGAVAADQLLNPEEEAARDRITRLLAGREAP